MQTQMEVDPPLEASQEPVANAEKENPISNPENFTQTSYLESQLGLNLETLGCSQFSYSDLITLISELKFKDKEKEKANVLKILISNIKSISTSKLSDLQSNREEKFYQTLNSIEKRYRTAENDVLSPTMYAYYFCDKSKQHLSDKEAATIKAIHMESNYDIQIDGRKKDKDDDELSSISNPIYANSSSKEPKLKKKRKNSFSVLNSTSGKSNKKKKLNKESDEEKNAHHSNEEIEYCLATCTVGRKNSTLSMIECDGCKGWFHFKCVGVPEESVKELKEDEWYCPNCKAKKNNDKGK